MQLDTAKQTLCVCVCAHVHALSRVYLRPYGLEPTRLLCPWSFPGKNTGVGCCFLLQRIFLTQGLNPCFLYLLHWQTDSSPLAPPGEPQIKLGVKANHEVCSRNSGRGKSVVSHQGACHGGVHAHTEFPWARFIASPFVYKHLSAASGKHDRSRNS